MGRAPTPTNDVTIFRTTWRIAGRTAAIREGVDVPFAWDGASTATVPVGSTTDVPFELVRIVAKKESPLVNLRSTARRSSPRSPR